MKLLLGWVISVKNRQLWNFGITGICFFKLAQNILRHEEGEKNNAYFLDLMNSKYTRLDLHKITDQEGTATDKKTIMEKVKGFYQKLYRKKMHFLVLFQVHSEGTKDGRLS